MYSPRASPAVGAIFGTPESARKLPGHNIAVPSLHKGEQAALGQFTLPPSIVAPPESLSNEFRQKQRDEPTAASVWKALHVPPAGAPSGGAKGPMPRQGNVLSSPRRVSVVGQTCHHASEWKQPATFTLETPYPMATHDSRFADAAEDKAALAAVAFTAGMKVAGPAAGMSSNKHSTLQDLPSLRQGMMVPGYQ